MKGIRVLLAKLGPAVLVLVLVLGFLPLQLSFAETTDPDSSTESNTTTETSTDSGLTANDQANSIPAGSDSTADPTGSSSEEAPANADSTGAEEAISESESPSESTITDSPGDSGSGTGPAAAMGIQPAMGFMPAAAWLVSTESALINAIANAASGDTITLAADIALTATLHIPMGKNVTLTGSYKLLGPNGANTIQVDGGGQLTLDGITVTHSAGQTGCGIKVLASGVLTMVSGAVTGNKTTSMAGGINNYGTVYLQGGSIDNNTASLSFGGGVYNNGTFTMSGGYITANTTDWYGGGVYNEFYSANFTMNGGTISYNYAPSEGGGVYNGGNFILNDGSIANNEAGAIGGGIDNWSTLKLYGGQIINNRAVGAGFGQGGGVSSDNRNSGGVVILDGTLISGNQAGYGGGILMTGHLTMNSGEISNNQAMGGAIYVTGSAAVFTMNGGSLLNNSSYGDGGAIYSLGAVNITGGTISGNYAPSYGLLGNGGAIYLDLYYYLDASISITSRDSSHPTTIVNNTATGDGGAVYVGAEYQKLQVGPGVIFADNVANAAYPSRDPALDAVYASNIAGTQWTTPFNQGFNNDDINAVYGDPALIENVTILNDGNGSAVGKADLSSSPLGASLTVVAGDTVRLSATPNSGYLFDHWSVDSGNTILSDDHDANATFTMPDSDVTVTACFALDDSDDNGDPVVIKNVIIQNDGNGSAVGKADLSSSPAGDSLTVEVGDTVRLSATPNSGYLFDHWSVDSGNTILSDDSDVNATFTMPDSDVTVTAFFVSDDSGDNGDDDPPVTLTSEDDPTPLAAADPSGLPITGDQLAWSAYLGGALLAVGALTVITHARRTEKRTK
ncbi:MAG: hypothetical protein FWC59_00610 [Actinomycetia bacterium]|nr:hypothetical protein [Actinomycetes bacterium]